jgi:polyisoprenoid-binding protein YceI
VIPCRSFRAHSLSRARAVWPAAALIVILPAGVAQPRQIDAAKSTITVRVYKAGMLAAFGHDHEITAPVAAGTVDENARKVELRVKSATLRVRDPNASEKDRDEIQKTMLGPQVLDVAKYAEISFRATSAESSGSQSWTVHGELTLHGQSHPVTVEVREQGSKYTGTSRFLQTEFGMTPVKVAGGTVKVKDEVQIEFDIELAH